jgi:hypothetical protein
MVDTVEALEEDAVESLIGQSISLRFVGLDCSLLLPSSINSYTCQVPHCCVLGYYLLLYTVASILQVMESNSIVDVIFATR